MELFAGILPFVHVAEARSFGKAAAALGVTTAAVSKAVAKLEGELGVVLLHRTSRHVALTPEGELFLARCREAVNAVHSARELVAETQKVAQGELSVTLPPILGRLVVPGLARLAARHPRLSFRLSLTDRVVRLAEEDIDVAIRMGELPDSSLVARPLRTPRWITLASPAYLARHGIPRDPDNLGQHNCLAFVTPRGTAQTWWFAKKRTPRSVHAKGNLLVDHGESLLQAAAAGMGVCQALDFMVEGYLRDGRLVEVLADHAVAGPPIHALCLPRRQHVPKVRAFLELLEEMMGRRA